MFCTDCGAQNPDDGKHCCKCGKQLYLPQSIAATTPEAQIVAADVTSIRQSASEPSFQLYSVSESCGSNGNTFVNAVTSTDTKPAATTARNWIVACAIFPAVLLLATLEISQTRFTSVVQIASLCLMAWAVLTNIKSATVLVWVGVTLAALVGILGGTSIFNLFGWLLNIGLAIWYTKKRSAMHSQPASTTRQVMIRKITWAVLTVTAITVFVAAVVLRSRNGGKDYVSSDGSKVFGERTLNDGTRKIQRHEYQNGEKYFNETISPDTTEKIERSELPSGQKNFDISIFRDGTQKIGRIELPDGKKVFDFTQFRDGTQNALRLVAKDGTQISQFWSAQNDQQGYADIKWGTKVTNVDPNATAEPEWRFSNDLQENEVVASALGVPTRDTTVVGVVLSTSINFSLVPSKFKLVDKGDVKLIFYADEFAMAFSKLDAHNYDAIASELASKFREMGSSSAEWGGGAASDGDNTRLNIRLFKRGETNTRIYLLKRTDHMGGAGMNISSVYMLYVPNYYFNNIQQDIFSLKAGKEAQQKAERENKIQQDVQKIQ